LTTNIDNIILQILIYDNFVRFFAVLVFLYNTVSWKKLYYVIVIVIY